MSDQLVHLGFCRKAHGIKGGFSFTLFNREDSVLCKGFEVTLIGLEGSSIKTISKHITSIAFGNKVIVYLEGIDSRTKAEELMPFDIFCQRSQLPQKDDEIYLVDFIGLIVTDHFSGENVGYIDSTYDNGEQDILVIVKKSGEKLELPFIENFFPVYDIENGIVEIILPEIE